MTHREVIISYYPALDYLGSLRQRIDRELVGYQEQLTEFREPFPVRVSLRDIFRGVLTNSAALICQGEIKALRDSRHTVVRAIMELGNGKAGSAASVIESELKTSMDNLQMIIKQEAGDAVKAATISQINQAIGALECIDADLALNYRTQVHNRFRI